MKVFRLSIHILMLLVVFAGAPTLIVSTTMMRSEQDRAQVRYQRTVRDYHAASQRYDLMEGKLRSLTRNVGAVEEEVREQLRMVRPDESLVVIRHEGVRDTPPDIVPPHQKPVKVKKRH